MATITGTNGNDFLGTDATNFNTPNTFNALAGDDLIRGGLARDVMLGGDGNDLFDDTTLAADLFDGGAGIDRVTYERGAFTDQPGVDLRVDLAAGTAQFAQGPAGGPTFAFDTLRSIEEVIGSRHEDRLVGDAKNNRLFGLDHDDELVGNGGHDFLFGGTGRDILRGGDGNDRITKIGDAQGDVIDGGAGKDEVYYLDHVLVDTPLIPGPELIVKLATGEASYVVGSALNPVVVNDTLVNVENVVGSFFVDRLEGDSKANVLQGIEGSDILFGNGGNDVLMGGAEYDVMLGGGGADRFRYVAASDAAPGPIRDSINDFSRSQGDKIDLREIDANEQMDGNQAFQFVG